MRKDRHTLTAAKVTGQQGSFTLASSVGYGSDKRLNFFVTCHADRADAAYKVLVHDRTAYIGQSLEEAIAAYNAAT